MTVAAVAYGPAAMSRWHPWRVLGRMPHVVVHWTDDLPSDVLGDTDGQAHIRMATDQLQVERRCTITHELIHIERGDRGHCTASLERHVEEEAARRLIPLPALAAALLWCMDEWELAEDLWVDQATVRIRLDTLTGAEQQYVESRIAAREQVA